jgi:hypothetical protein
MVEALAKIIVMIHQMIVNHVQMLMAHALPADYHNGDYG